MAEKRFSSDGWSITDGEHRIGMIQATNLLNELAEENEICKTAYLEIKENAIKLKEENERLKTREETLLSEIEDFQELLKKIDDENEQLRSCLIEIYQISKNESVE